LGHAGSWGLIAAARSGLFFQRPHAIDRALVLGDHQTHLLENPGQRGILAIAARMPSRIQRVR